MKCSHCKVERPLTRGGLTIGDGEWICRVCRDAEGPWDLLSPERMQALEAKCDLLSASLKKQDDELALLRQLETGIRHDVDAGGVYLGKSAQKLLEGLDALRGKVPGH